MLNAKRVAWAGALLVFGLAATPALAEAGPTEKAAAEALFDDALRSMKSGDYSAACPKLESSQRIDPAVGTLLYLGECYERLGRTASAWATFREAASSAQAAGQADRAKTAQSRAARVESELGYLSVEVAAETLRIPGLVVRRSGAHVASDLFGVASPADPGEVEIEAAAPGHATFVTRATVIARNTSRIQIPALAKTPEPSAESAAALKSRGDTAPPAQSARSSEGNASAALRDDPLRPLAYVLGGAGILGLGVGSYFGLRAISKNSDAEKVCPNNFCSPDGLALTSQAEDAAVISNVAFAVGGASLAAGIVIFALTPARREAALRVTPHFDRQSAGISVQGRL